MQSMPTNRRVTAASYAIFALGILTFASTVVAVWQHFSPLPYGDSWDGTIGFYLRAMQDPWQAFFEQHNEHRLAFSRLIFFADVRYFGGRNVFSLIANLILAGALATAFYRIAQHHSTTLSRATRFGLAGAALVFNFSWIQQENFTWGFQSQWFAVYLFALLAFHSIELHAEADTRKQPAWSLGWFLAAIASACAAACSMASGVLVLPVMIVQALYLRVKPWTLLVLASVTCAVWFTYFIDWQKPPSSGSLENGLLEHPFIAARFVLLYLGAPASHVRLGLPGAYASGVLVLAVLLTSCIKALRSQEKRPVATALLALALFVAGNALLTATGRLWYGVETALFSRYTTASLAAWLALIIFAVLNSDMQKQRRRACMVAMFATALVASDQRFAFKSAHDEVYAHLVAGLALRAHVYDPAVTRALYPFPDLLIPISKQAEAAQLSLFAPDQPDYLVPPNRISAAVACDGGIDSISATTTPGIDRASGWIYETAEKRVPRAIVITDASGTSLGTGVSGGERNDIETRFGHSARYSGWTAYFKPPTEGGITIAGQLAANTYCAMQGERSMPSAHDASPR